MPTIVYVVLTVVWIIADILDCRSNKRLSKQLEEAKKALDDNASLTKKYQSITEGMLEALNNKTTAQDNYLWKSILILAQKIGEQNHARS